MSAHKGKSVVFALGLLVVATAFLACVVMFINSSVKKSNSPFEKSVRLSFELHNQSRDFIESFELISYLPVDAGEYQKLVNVDSNTDYSILTSEERSDIKLPVKNLPPFGYRTVNFTATVRGFDSPKYIAINKSDYLAPDQYIEINSPEVLAVVDGLKAQGIDQAESIYQWVRGNIRDSGYISKNMGAKYALTQNRGDCTEYMYAFVALARANGIPARGVAGFFVEGDASLVNSSDYHNWAEYHDGDKWILVDPYKGYFNEKYKNYIAFRFVGNGVESQSGLSASRFMSVGARVSVKL